MQVFEQLSVPHYHVIGNHELYHLPRKHILKRQAYPTVNDPNAEEDQAYYHVCVPDFASLFQYLTLYVVLSGTRHSIHCARHVRRESGRSACR